MNYIKFPIPTKKMDPAKVMRLEAAFTALKEVRAEIEADWKASPEGLGVAAIHSKADYRSEIDFTWGTNNGVDASVRVQIDHDANRAMGLAPTSLNIGEKTINALLTGKLLTDAEKKALLKRLGVELDEKSPDRPQRSPFTDYVPPKVV